MMNTTNPHSNTPTKWPEVWSLAALNAAVVISWIAYHEYQPKLLDKFSLTGLSSLLVVAKALILVFIPPVAGLIADKVLQRGGNYFTVFTSGIGVTAMIFMIVASLVYTGPDSVLSIILPVMVVLWLIAMNIFHSPANSMIIMFAPVQKLPLIMGVLIMTTELLYALEPIVVFIVDFLGDTLTFITGGILIATTGWLFNKVSSDEVLQRKDEALAEGKTTGTTNSFLGVIITGLIVGVGHAFLAGYIPVRVSSDFSQMLESGWRGEYLSSILLGISAILAFPLSIQICRIKTSTAMLIAMLGIAAGALTMLVSQQFYGLLLGGIILSIAFSVASVSGLPFAIRQLTLRHITLGVGVFFGATEIFDGLFDLIYTM